MSVDACFRGQREWEEAGHSDQNPLHSAIPFNSLMSN
jgi:hypothetical protein